MSAAMGAGMAANFLGAVMQAIAASQAAKEMDRVYTDYTHRNNRYTKQAQQTYEGSLPARERSAADAEIAQGAAGRQATYDRMAATPMSMTPGQGPTSLDKASAGMVGANRAALGGYSDWAINQAIRDLRTQQQLNQISNFAGGMANVMPYELDDAKNSWNELAFHGQMLQSLGGAASNFGSLYGGNSPMSSAPSPLQSAALQAGQGPVSQQYANQWFGGAFGNPQFTFSQPVIPQKGF